MTIGSLCHVQRGSAVPSGRERTSGWKGGLYGEKRRFRPYSKTRTIPKDAMGFFVPFNKETQGADGKHTASQKPLLWGVISFPMQNAAWECESCISKTCMEGIAHQKLFDPDIKKIYIRSEAPASLDKDRSSSEQASPNILTWMATTPP